MDTHDKLTQDNEPLTFQALGLAAALVVNRIRNAQALRELGSEEQKEEGKGNPEPSDKDEQRAKEHREYVKTRLREITAWEAKLMRNRN